MNNAWQIVKKFIVDNELVLYGGLAIDAFIKKSGGTSHQFYTMKDEPDYDMYSPTPWTHMCQLCQQLHDAGFKNIRGYEAEHQNTYKIRIENSKGEVADISYMSPDLFKTIKKQAVLFDGLSCAPPHWLIIDQYFRKSNPISGWFKIEKTLYRVILLEHFYLAKEKQRPSFKGADSLVKKVISLIVEGGFFDSKKHILLGDVGYNIYQTFGNVKNNQIPVQLLECLSKDAYELMNEVKNYLMKKLRKVKIYFKSYYGFCNYYYRMFELNINRVPIIRCFQTESTHGTSIIKVEWMNRQVYIGSYFTLLMHTYINLFRSLMDDNNIFQQKFKYMISQLYVARRAYEKDNELVDSPFADLYPLIMEQGYETINYKLQNQNVKKYGKSLYKRSYRPPSSHIRAEPEVYPINGTVIPPKNKSQH